MEMDIFVPLTVSIDQAGSDGIYKNTFVKINPYSSYDNHPDMDGKMLDFLATTCYFYRDTVNINGTEVTVTAANSKYDIIPDDVLSPGTKFNFMTECQSYQSVKDYVIGDTLMVADKMLYLRKLDNNILYMDDLGHFADSSKVGSYLPALFAKDLNDNTLRLLNNDFKDKYVLIDFWGSWCGPCIAGLPEMVKLNEEIKNRKDAMIVGIAVEFRESDLKKLKGIIDDKGVTWANYWQGKSAENSHATPAGKLGIYAYPSYIITDKSGKIVFLSEGQTLRTENALDFFRALINGK